MKVFLQTFAFLVFNNIVNFATTIIMGTLNNVNAYAAYGLLNVVCHSVFLVPSYGIN